MKAPLIDQHSAEPTRKMLYGAVSAVATAAAQRFVLAAAEKHPLLDWLASDVTLQALPIIVGFGVGYAVRDRAV